MRQLIFLLFPFISLPIFAQEDSTRVLEMVVVSAFQYNKPLADVPVSIAVVTTEQLSRFQNTSFVSAVNTVPGVRMEERSPGSYRFSIRGSLLRSPFGIRNVKFYLNGLPLTDGGGNTYLNLLDVTSVSSMEIIKGPGASTYGAGTGGVVLMHNDASVPLGVQLQYGGFNLLRVQGGGTLVANEKDEVNFTTASQRGDGYREHSAMKRFNTSLDWSHLFSTKSKLGITFLTSDLFYETPGGLTKTQAHENPIQARPPTATTGGAVQQKASISNRTHYASARFEDEWNSDVLFKTGVFASYTDFKNLAIMNVEEREEYNVGGRTEVVWNTTLFNAETRFNTGVEYQFFHSPLNVFDNELGVATDLQTKDRLTSFAGLVFVQGEVELPHGFRLTTGGSLNFLQYKFQRTFPVLQQQTRTFSPGFYPRLALLKKIKSLSLFTSISKGFSPPTWAEVRPSEGTYNNNLKAEYGTNVEAGIKGTVKRLKYEAAVYQFNLKDAIVIQRTEDGADYFLNAGGTKQRGAEVFLSYSSPSQQKHAFEIWTSYSLNDYYFHNYSKDNVNYSGKRLTGVSPNNASAGLDFSLQSGLYIRTTCSYVDHLPLNDANTEYAKEYWLLSARAGYQLKKESYQLELFIAGDNLLNEIYSLGNDLNAAGGRYYNTAAERNFTVGLRCGLN